MNSRKISPNVWHIGVDDHKTQLFESLWPLPYGVSYNSYVVKGERTALIDTVEEHFTDEFFAHLDQAGVSSPSYLIVNHMEPDHSGSLPALAARFPDMTIVGNALTIGMIKGYYPEVDSSRLMTVKDGEEIDLGGTTLSFHTIPMVHWPETMVTYIKETGVLFSGDAFGTFGALNGAVLDADINDITPYINEMYRYYACIVAKYAEPVQRALAKLKPITLNMVCPTHGPVWEKHIDKVIGLYDTLSSHRADKGVVLVYGSMYGHTREMANIIHDELAAIGTTAKVYDASRTDLSFVLADIWKYDALIVGSPTYNASVLPPIQALLSALEMRGLRNRRTAAFGNFTWASAATAKIRDAFSRLGLDEAAEPVTVKMKPTQADHEMLRRMTHEITGE